jgi:GntR family transcriptional regulator
MATPTTEEGAVLEALFDPPAGFDRVPGVPAHAAIERWFLDAIERGDLVAGDRLPREQDLAAAFGVSRMTLRQALATLAGRGIVRRTPGRFGGTSIAVPTVERDLSGPASFTEQLRRAHLRAGARVVEAVTVPASRAAAEALELRPGDPVHRVVRVRTAQGQRLALEHSHFPEQTFPDLLRRRLTGSLYDVLRTEYGQRPVTATEVLEPVVSREEEAGLLDVEPGAPLLLVVRVAYAASCRPVEYARDLFRPDRVKVFVRSRLDEPDATASLPARSAQT